LSSARDHHQKKKMVQQLSIAALLLVFLAPACLAAPAENYERPLNADCLPPVEVAGLENGAALSLFPAEYILRGDLTIKDTGYITVSG
jgi:hypothetical protein